jgi:hypothetical protein
MTYDVGNLVPGLKQAQTFGGLNQLMGFIFNSSFCVLDGFRILLFVLFLLAIVLSVLRFTDSDYPFIY